MKAIRVRTRLDSDTVHIPELAEMVGIDVEIPDPTISLFLCYN